MSVTLMKTGSAYGFVYACDSCKRPAILALNLPAGWEILREEDGLLRHACAGCVFDRLVESLGWEREE